MIHLDRYAEHLALWILKNSVEGGHVPLVLQTLDSEAEKCHRRRPGATTGMLDAVKMIKGDNVGDAHELQTRRTVGSLCHYGFRGLRNGTEGRKLLQDAD